MAPHTPRPTAKLRGKKKQERSVFPIVIGGGAVIVIFGVFFLLLGLQPAAAPKLELSTRGAAAADYAVGSPGMGVAAPEFSLESTRGDTVQLSDYAGRSVLLYFHEGLGCQPCWDQMGDLDAASDELTDAGIDDVVAITSGPVDLIAQKMDDDGLASLALADTKMDVIKEYGANDYGMMGDSRAGHSFVLVGPDGTIQWRADYGGAPDYTMYVSVADLLSDMTAAGGERFMIITILTQESCPSCVKAKGTLSLIKDEYPVEVVEVPLATEKGRQMASRAGVMFAPGILIDGTLFSYGRLSEKKLRRHLSTVDWSA